MYPRLYGTAGAVTNRTQMSSLTTCAGYHSMKEHLYKLNTNVQIIPGHAHIPSTSHSGTQAQHSNFRSQRISSTLISPISRKNFPTQGHSGVPGMPKSWDIYGPSSQSTNFIWRFGLLGMGDYLSSLKFCRACAPASRGTPFPLVCCIPAASVKVQGLEHSLSCD